MSSALHGERLQRLLDATQFTADALRSDSLLLVHRQQHSILTTAYRQFTPTSRDGDGGGGGRDCGDSDDGGDNGAAGFATSATPATTAALTVSSTAGKTQAVLEGLKSIRRLYASIVGAFAQPERDAKLQNLLVKGLERRLLRLARNRTSLPLPQVSTQGMYDWLLFETKWRGVGGLFWFGVCSLLTTVRRSCQSRAGFCITNTCTAVL